MADNERDRAYVILLFEKKQQHEVVRSEHYNQNKVTCILIPDNSSDICACTLQIIIRHRMLFISRFQIDDILRYQNSLKSEKYCRSNNACDKISVDRNSRATTACNTYM